MFVGGRLVMPHFGRFGVGGDTGGRQRIPVCGETVQVGSHRRGRAQHSRGERIIYRLNVRGVSGRRNLHPVDVQAEMRSVMDRCQVKVVPAVSVDPLTDTLAPPPLGTNALEGAPDDRSRSSAARRLLCRYTWPARLRQS